MLFRSGEAREDWAILRALSDVLGKRLPYNDMATLRAAMVADAPHFATTDRAAANPGADAAIWTNIGTKGTIAKSPFAYPLRDFYLTNPIARASVTMQRCSAELLHGQDFAEAAE